MIELSKGINGLVNNGGKIHIVASPRLTEEDVNAIEYGFELKDKVIEKSLMRELNLPKNKFEEERLNYLANLIADGILDIKIAFLEELNEVAMFHIKTGLMHDAEGNTIAFTGSMNESAIAFSHNYESVDVYKSWSEDGKALSETEIRRIELKQLEFLNIWDNCQPKIKVQSFLLVKEEIIKKYLRSKIYNYCRYQDSEEANNFSWKKRDESDSHQLLQKTPFVPSDINIRDYQANAVKR